MFTNQLANFTYKNIPANLLVFPKDEKDLDYRYFVLIDNKGNLGEIYLPELGDSDLKAYLGRVKGYFNSVKN